MDVTTESDIDRDEVTVTDWVFVAPTTRFIEIGEVIVTDSVFVTTRVKLGVIEVLRVTVWVLLAPTTKFIVMFEVIC